MIKLVQGQIQSVLRDALRPTLLSLVWLFLLLILKTATATGRFPTWPEQARTSLHSSFLPSNLDQNESGIDPDAMWKDAEWAAYRVMTSLSTVTGLLLAFRSNSAMERWSTARRKWSDVLATSRSLLRLLSPSLLSAPLQGNDDNTAATKSLADFAQAQGRRREAEATLASIPFFSISLMHEMRGIPLSLRSSSSELTGLLRDDLISLLPPALVAAVNRQNADPAARTSPNKASEEEKRKQMANLNSPHIIQSLAHSNASSVNLALASLVLLQQHLDHFHESTVLSGPIYAHSIGLVNSLSLHMTELERVRDTPIPHAVSKHFLRLLTIHTVLLPVVVVQRLHSERWWMGMAIVGLVTSMLYGVDSFAARLGQPMGLDREDLPLEKYVADVQRQWAEVRDCCGTSK